MSSEPYSVFFVCDFQTNTIYPIMCLKSTTSNLSRERLTQLIVDRVKHAMIDALEKRKHIKTKLSTEHGKPSGVHVDLNTLIDAGIKSETIFAYLIMKYHDDVIALSNRTQGEE